MKAATPHGELPSDGCWCALRLLSHGVMNQRTMAISTNGTTTMSQLPSFSAVSTMSSWCKYQDIQKKNDITAKMKRTGYGRGFRVKASWMMSLLLLLSYIADFLSLVSWYGYVYKSFIYSKETV